MNRKYNDEHIEFIKANICELSFNKLAEIFNHQFGMASTASMLSALADKHGLHNGRNTQFKKGTKEWESTQFKKGHVPANKGKKCPTVGNMAVTQFKKGHVPVNYRPVGSERINVDGYVEIKVTDSNKWRLKHQVVYEQGKRPISKGHAVIFGDGDKLNLNIDNLLLVSRAQLAILNRNRLIQKDADLTKSAIIITDLLHKISERGKK